MPLRQFWRPALRLLWSAVGLAVGELCVFALDVSLPLRYLAASAHILVIGLAFLTRSTGLVYATAATATAATIGATWLKISGDAMLLVSLVVFNRSLIVLLIFVRVVAGTAFQRRARRLAKERMLAAKVDRILQGMPIIVWTAGRDGTLEFINDVSTRHSGSSATTLIGQRWRDVIHPEDLDRWATLWHEAIEASEPQELEARIRCRDGAYRFFLITAWPECAPDGSVLKWWGTAMDIHETRKLRREAQRVAEAHERILQSIGDGVSEMDRNFILTFVSDRGAAIVGKKRSEIEGMSVWEAFPQLHGGEVEDMLRAALATGRSQSFTTHNPVLSRWFEVTASPTDHGLTVVFRNVTETHEQAEQLHTAQRLESVGQLTGGIAHDFNNLLTVVLGGADAVREGGQLDAGDDEMLGLVAQAAERGAELTASLLTFARRMPLAARPVDLNAEVRGVISLIERTIGSAISVRLVLADGLPNALVDPTRFESAILNLAINARDAMPDGGSLAIETARVDVDDEYSARDPELAAGPYIVTSVADSGTGIEPAIRNQLFDPFFTTKAAGHGSGLGLAMVWGFAKQSGGHVSVYSEVGLGTTFRIFLPVSYEEASTPAPAAPEDAGVGTGHVLVAEDDPLVLDYATSQLRARGYQVTGAASGPEALAALEGIPHLDLLFTDVIMTAGMTGRDLANEVTRLRPGTAVLYTSGYPADVLTTDGRLDSGVDLLPKPYTARALAARLARLLAATSEQ